MGGCYLFNKQNHINKHGYSSLFTERGIVHYSLTQKAEANIVSPNQSIPLGAVQVCHCKKPFESLRTGLDVIKLEYSLKLKIKCDDRLLAETCLQAANHCTLF